MAYIPKKRVKGSKVFIILSLITALFIGAFVMYMSQSKLADNDAVSVCGYTKSEVEKKVKRKFADDRVYEISDYLFYGESLAIFKEEYTGEDIDGLSGKTIKLKDVCSNQVYAFVLDRKVDRKVLLGNLQPGLYEMYVVEDLVEKRVYYPKSVSDSIDSLTRKGVNHKVTFLASTSLLEDYDIALDRNYAFINVVKTEIDKDEYDIVIDPAGNDASFSFGQVDVGGQANGLIEANETYDAAVKLKTALEAKGLKVMILREADEVKNTYGLDGRLELAYRVKAKYYIRLAFMLDPNTSFRGYTVYHSSHATNMLAARIGYDFSKETQMEPTTIFMGVSDDEGIIESGIVRSALDQRDVYDADLWIRESGGRATQAGMFSQNTIEGTAQFAKDNPYGMNGIDLYLGYLSNINDVEYWKVNKQLIIDTLANSIAVYLNIEE